MFHVKLRMPARAIPERQNTESNVERTALGPDTGGPAVLTHSNMNAFTVAPQHLTRSNPGTQSVVELTHRPEPLDHFGAVSTDR
jgi:hypothetical protein